MYAIVARESRCWKCGVVKLSLDTPLVMGILNVTPDSFYDGGRYFDTKSAVEHALKMIYQGADIIDVGGESTRPGADKISVDIELRRVIPVVKALTAEVQVPISIDTRHAVVAEAAVNEGAVIINNIMPLAGDAAMVRVAAESGAGLVVMHMRGTPASMSSLAVYDNVIEEVVSTLEESLAFGLENGVAAEQMVVDPGIGFAKDLTHNLKLLAGVDELRKLAPVLVGASRKRFIGEACHASNADDRVGGSVGVAVWCALQGASIIRVHDVKESQQALAIVNEIRKAGEKRD